MKQYLFGFLLFVSTCISAKDGSDGPLYFYTGFNSGFYAFHQAPLEYRAWEFNNSYTPSKKMVADPFYRGFSFGANLGISLDATDKFELITGVQLDLKHNKMEGTGTSSNGEIQQYYNEKTGAFYYGFGITTPAKSAKTGNLNRFSIGYMPMVGWCKLTLMDKQKENGQTTSTGVNFKGSTILMKHLITATYRINSHLKVCAFPYFENHLIGTLQAIYDNKNTHAYQREYYNVKSFGIDLCIGYCF